MKLRMKLAIKCVLFILITTLCVISVNRWMRPKYFYNDEWPTTSTYSDFYDLKKNTVDVLFLGSSHAASSFNPQVIYDSYGITSYNLGCEQQSIFMSYYWLKEALKYQSPSLVVLETYTFFKYTDAYVYNRMNCSEAALRKTLDCMKLSPLKIRAALEVERIDPSQSALSYILTNIRYHNRWMNLGENDYTGSSMAAHGGIKGYSFRTGTDPGAEDVVFSDSDAAEAEGKAMAWIAEEYLDRIVRLCREKGIRLVFVKIPSGESAGRYRTTREYADQNGIDYYDFNEEKLYHELAYSAERDRYSHPNWSGAEKISLYIGRLLREKYAVAPREDSSYEKSGKLFRHLMKNAEIQEEDDACRYLGLLKDEQYTVFVLAPSVRIEDPDADIAGALKSLGFQADLEGADSSMHYCAVADAGGVTEKLTADDMSFSGSVRGGLIPYTFRIDTSVMRPRYHTYSLMINGVEYGGSGDGMRIVVYDNELKGIIDTATIMADETGARIGRQQS